MLQSACHVHLHIKRHKTACSGGGASCTDVSDESHRGGEVWRGGGNEGDNRSLFHQHFLLTELSSRPPLKQRCVVRPSICPPTVQPSLGLFLLGEVEDLAVGLPQVLLLFEVHLKRPLDGHKGDTSL